MQAPFFSFLAPQILTCESSGTFAVYVGSGVVIPHRWYCETILKTDLSGSCEDEWHFCYAFSIVLAS